MPTVSISLLWSHAHHKHVYDPYLTTLWEYWNKQVVCSILPWILCAQNFYVHRTNTYWKFPKDTTRKIGRQKWLNLLSFCVSCEDLAVSISFVRCRKHDSFNASDIILSIRVLDHCKKYQTSWYQERLVCMDWGVKRRRFLKLT